MGRSGSLYTWLYPHLGVNYDKKRWGPRRSPSFLQSCLYIKDTQTKFSSPDQSGRHSACYYYSIVQCYLQGSCTIFSEMH